MLQIKPYIQHKSTCPHCQSHLKNREIIWHGMFTCVNSNCPNCHAEIVEDLHVGHAVNTAFQIDVAGKQVFGDYEDVGYQAWLGEPLLKSLQNPQTKTINIKKEILKSSNQVIILNCIDYLYGHSLLKLLNAQRHLEQQPEYGLIVIIPKFLRWMVPDGVAEIWTVDIPLKNGQDYYPHFNQFVHEELKRFDEVYVSKAHSHPSKFDISKFTKIPKHNFAQEEFRITYIWREDRIWCGFPFWSILRRLNLINLALLIQNWKIKRLFKALTKQLPTAKLTVVGLGKKTIFPEWIEDLRVDKFDEKTEKAICQIYSESRLIIGVHGSNMLLPSGHAGMTIDLMTKEKWRMFASDILYHETDPRLASFRYRYLPLEINVENLAFITQSMFYKWTIYQQMMIADK